MRTNGTLLCAAALALSALLPGSERAAPTSGRNGDVVRTNGSDPLHVCATEAPFDSPRVRHDYEPHEQRQLRSLVEDGRRLLRELEAKHRRLMLLEANLTPERHVIVLEDLEFQRSNLGLFHERRTAAVRYLASTGSTPGPLACVIVDSFVRHDARPEQWTRRIARVHAGKAHAENAAAGDDFDIVFETVVPDRKHAASLDDMDGPVRVRAIRKVNAYLRDILYVLDLKIAQLTPEEE